MLIKACLAPDYDIKFHELLPGRLLHARVPLRQHCLDIIGGYQHAWTNDSSKQVLDRRFGFWTKLSGCLGQLPARNMLILAGDFNCSLPVLPGATGPGRIAGTFHFPVVDSFVAIVETHGPCALSTWLHKTSRCMATMMAASPKSTTSSREKSMRITRRAYAPPSYTRTLLPGEADQSTTCCRPSPHVPRMAWTSIER